MIGQIFRASPQDFQLLPPRQQLRRVIKRMGLNKPESKALDDIFVLLRSKIL
ncbi:MAG: hypothetical protein P4L87_05015 [Formivibrio sp.]|nr:hypothetical protein [Formivibrio sp.]